MDICRQHTNIGIGLNQQLKPSFRWYVIHTNLLIKHFPWNGEWRVGDIHVVAVEEGWERIRCGVQDVKGGVIRDVRV